MQSGAAWSSLLLCSGLRVPRVFLADSLSYCFLHGLSGLLLKGHLFCFCGQTSNHQFPFKDSWPRITEGTGIYVREGILQTLHLYSHNQLLCFIFTALSTTNPNHTQFSSSTGTCRAMSSLILLFPSDCSCQSAPPWQSLAVDGKTIFDERAQQHSLNRKSLIYTLKTLQSIFKWAPDPRERRRLAL